MAASEARTACQRMANRSFVQEDAKRAPKLACYPPSSSKQQTDSTNGDSNGADQPASSFWPLKRDSMSNLQPDMKWWLQLQPNSVYLKDVTSEQLCASEGFVDCDIPTSKLLGDENPIAAAYVESDNKSSFSEAPWKFSSNCLKHETEVGIEQPNSLNNIFQHQTREKTDLCEHWYQNEELMDWKTFDQLFPKKPEKACFDMETSWMGIEKTEPWWRTADKDELASLVAQKSLRNIENCDLPPPQKVHFCRGPFGCVEAFDDSMPLSLEPKLQAGTCTLDYTNKSCSSVSVDGRHQTSGEVGHYGYGSEKTCSEMHTYKMYNRDPPESKHHPECDSSKAELLEALCHSQTRAREAEMAAQKAYNEREHIVKLFFKQASQVFAYKQWIRMLQLESLFLQLKLKEHQISSLFPVLPWSPMKGSKYGCEAPKVKKRKCRKHQKCNICKYAVAFAVGFGLSSAGLLLGWTLGWLLPAS